MAPPDDVVAQVLGDWGPWQFRTIALIFLIKIPAAWLMACLIFTAPVPRPGSYVCKPKSGLIVTPENWTEWVRIVHPVKEETVEQGSDLSDILGKDFIQRRTKMAEEHHRRAVEIDYCNVYKDAFELFGNLSSQELIKESETFQQSLQIVPCESFEHETDFWSVITQFDLVCSKTILVAVTQSFHLLGVLLGGIVATGMLKTVRPKTVMLIGYWTMIFCGTLTGLVDSYWLHAWMRCMSALCLGLSYTSGALIFSDITGGTYRRSCIALFESFWSIGVILLPGLASFCQNWTQLYFALSWPTLALVFLSIWITESPRWLMTHRKVSEAKEILLKAAKFNKTESMIPENLEERLKKQAGPPENPPAGWLEMWTGSKRHKNNLILVHLAWGIYPLVYYGTLLNIRVYDQDYIVLNTIVAGLCELIGNVTGWALIIFTEHPWLWTSALNVIGGLMPYTVGLVPRGRLSLNAYLMMTTMVTKMAISCTLGILTTCTVELVAVNKRKITGFSTVVWGRIWFLLAPLLGATGPFLGKYAGQIIFGTMVFAGGIITGVIRPEKSAVHPSNVQGLSIKRLSTRSAKTEPNCDIFVIKA